MKKITYDSPLGKSLCNMMLHETKNVELDKAYTSSHPYVQPGHYVMIAVTDSGIGIPDELKERIFSPNFSTKNSGMGLGLALSKKMVEQFGGSIDFKSKPGKGTTFFVKLPLAKEQ